MAENKDFDAERLKLLWERLQKEQKDAPYNKRANISRIKIVDDGKGGKTVQISLSNGCKINDVGDKGDLFRSMIPKKRINLGRLIALLSAVRSLGFDAVAMGLPPELKRALLQACKKCGIPLKIERVQKKQNNLSNKPKEEKNLRPVSKQRADVAPVVKWQKPRPSFSTMTSPRSLDVAVRFQQKRNKEYLATRMTRCENEAKDEFLTLCCQVSSGLGRKDANKLTAEEKEIKAFIERYAGKSGNAGEILSRNRDKILNKMSLKDLPENLQKKCSEKQKRYKYLCDARNKALEMTQVELKKKYYQKDMPINLSIAALVKLSAAKMPPPEKWNVYVLAETVSNFNNHLKESRKELKDTLREKRKKIGALLAEKFVSKTEKKTLQPVLHTERRHNFIENALVRKMQEKSAVAY